MNTMPSASFSYPDFESTEFLKDHLQKVLNFYRGRALDPRGGFFHGFEDDGTLFDKDFKHLVSSCRFIFNFAGAYCREGNPEDLALAEHGLQFLTSAHKMSDGFYAWELTGGQVSDGRAMAYGHAFVLFAAAHALQAGLASARSVLDEVWSLLEQHFWEPSQGAYLDELGWPKRVPDSYRGQNANMHMCEACLAAWKATSEEKFLDRAERLAQKFALELADLHGGLVWEHYTQDWLPDMEYHKDQPDDLFKPWGFQPGHQVEWARLLLSLLEIRPQSWYQDRAETLYKNGMKDGRDADYGGVFYGFAPDGETCAPTKYFWVQAESIATAWRLFWLTEKPDYRDDYLQFWRYAWDHFVDHQHGAWFRILSREGQKIDRLKSPPGKTDYHVLTVCWDILDHQL